MRWAQELFVNHLFFYILDLYFDFYDTIEKGKLAHTFLHTLEKVCIIYK